MTDRVKGFYVALEEDIRIDDFESMRQAVLQLRGVENVTAEIADHDDWMNRERVKGELRQSMMQVLLPSPPFRSE